LEKGANPDDENKFGFSMTKNIAGVGNPELLKLCLERGGRHDASFKAKFPVSLLFSGMRLKKRMDKQFHYLTHLVARIEGSVPLHQAAEMGNVEGIRILLESKAKVDALTRDGQTALNLAEKLGHSSASLLLRDVTPGINNNNN